MKGKLLTIAGIALIFGYFISDSLRNPSDPAQVVMVGGDTLGRDWGAMAEQKLKDAAQQNDPNVQEKASVNINQYDNAPLIKDSEDPYSKDKLNSSNYSYIQDGNGREVIVGYNRYEEEQQQDLYQTRHQQESDQTQEPTIIYKE